jgi:hypothetical protein
MIFQQGDVIFKKVDGVQGDKRVNEDFILVRGEATGHHHSVAIADREQVEIFERKGTLFMKVKDPVVIEHQEHRPITLPAGDYEIGQVREYDHFVEEARKVQD